MSFAWLKSKMVVGSLGKLTSVSLLVLAFGTGCGDDPKHAAIEQGCTLNSDCNGGLVCSFGLCHQECAVSSDCPSGQRCIQTDSANVCQLTDESQCHFNSDCQDPLVCAIDRQCRNQCNKDKDCLSGQTCADSVCADPQEVDADGHVKGAVGAGGAGGEGNMPECKSGADCVPDGMPCQVGVVRCRDGVASCESAVEADDGTECGTNQVCSGGECVDCVAGDTCADPKDPDNTCLVGTVTCAMGPDCEITSAKAGRSCGTDQVCDGSGTCVDCTVDAACDPPGQACKNGKQSCSKGPVCTPTTTKDAGSECGTDMVCDSAAKCVGCVQDGPCAPESQECHVGLQDCKMGPNCVDTLVSAGEGISCTGSAAYNFCTKGVCEACQNGNPCVPMTNECHKGTLNCSTQPPTCNDTSANADDGFPCGGSSDKSCISGKCVTNDRVLTVTTASFPDVAIDNSFATVAVHLVDKDNKPVQGAAVTVVASPGAYGASTATNASGNAQISGRVGRAVGKYTFTVSAPGSSTAQFSVNAVAPADKSILTVVNTGHLSGAAKDGPGTQSQLYYEANSVVAAKDGTLYIGDYCSVYSLTPAGVLTRVAGLGGSNCGGSGSDSGLGTSVMLYNVSGLALDEANKFLYIADSSNRLVRQLDLSSGNILTFAGSSSATNAKPWGDGGPADSAYLTPISLAVAPNGDLYIGDSNSGSIRKVDFNTSVISAVVAGTYYTGAGCDAAGALTLYYCGGEGDACSEAWDKDGKLFVSGYFCGLGNSSFKGIARVEGDGSLSLVAGTYGSPTVAEGGAATSAVFASTPSLAFDHAGNLFITTRSDNRVRRIDALTTKITTVAGTGTAGTASGDYAVGTAAVVNNPTTVTFDGAGNLYFADTSNYSIRTVYGIGNNTTPTGKLATVSGGGQTVKRDAAFGALLVKLTDVDDNAISGVNVAWKRLQTGSGLGASGSTTLGAKTNSSGNAAMTGRVGLAKGDYGFEASYTDIHGTPVTGSPQSFTVTAEDPAAGTIFPVVNYIHTSGTGGYPGPATFAKLQSYAFGVAASSDGTIYSSDYCAVYATTSRGEISVFAGTPGSCGNAGDSGPAVGAKLYYPEGMALDETNGVLYIADTGNQLIRSVNLDTGIIDTFAGGGSVTTAPFGDGGQATDANIGSVQSVAVGPDGKVYFPDTAHYYMRVVDPTTGVISKWFTPSYSGSGGAGCVAATASYYYPSGPSPIAFAANGDAYMAGYICQESPSTTTYGIVKRAANGSFTRIAGLNTGTTTDNILAVNASIPGDISDILIDGNGNLVLALYSSHKVRTIDMTSGKINTIAGDGTAGYSLPTDTSTEPGAYVAASGVRVYYPYKLALWPGNHLLIADEYNYVTRMIW